MCTGAVRTPTQRYNVSGFCGFLKSLWEKLRIQLQWEAWLQKPQGLWCFLEDVPGKKENPTPGKPVQPALVTSSGANKTTPWS